MKRTYLNPISKKRQKELREENEMRKALLIECKGLCMECGERPDWRGLSLHHEKFKSHGGDNSYSNVKLLCGRCHSGKHRIKEV